MLNPAGKHIKISQSQIIESYNQALGSSDSLRDSDASYRWVLNKLKVKSGTKLIDIAFGQGILIKEAVSMGLDVYAVDVSATAAYKTSKELNYFKIMVSNGENLPFPAETFDFATNLGSLEHFINPEVGIQEVSRVIKPDGKAALLLPNSYYLVDLITKVLWKGYGPTHHQILERFATMNEWKELIEANGLKVERVFKYNFLFPQRKSDWAWYQKRLRRILPPLVGLVTPFNLSFSFLYICSPSFR